MIWSKESVRMLKQAVVAYLTATTWNFPGKTEDNHKYLPSRQSLAVVWTSFPQMWVRHVTNVLTCYNKLPKLWIYKLALYSDQITVLWCLAQDNIAAGSSIFITIWTLQLHLAVILLSWILCLSWQQIDSYILK
jgi:hypothetical protein